MRAPRSLPGGPSAVPPTTHPLGAQMPYVEPNASKIRARAGSGSLLLATLVAGALLAGCGDSPSQPTIYPGINLSKTSLATTEGGANVTFDVRLNTPPSSSVYISLNLSDSSEGGMMEAGDVYAYSYAYLTFTPADWNVPQTITVVPMNDTITDGNQTYTITATASSYDANYAAVPARTISVTNADDDVPAVTISKTTASTGEGGTTDTFTVHLNTAPTTAVVIPVTTTDTTEGLLIGGNYPSTPSPTINLTFTTVDWSYPQTVTIYGQGDLVDDGNQTYAVTVGKPTGAPEYAALAQQTVSVTNVDDDTAGITVTAGATPLVTSENGTTATFTVQLNTQPTADVTVAVKSGNVAEGLLSAGVENLLETVHLVFTTANWSTPQQVTVTGQNEVTTQVPSDNVTYDVTVGPATGETLYAAVATQTVQVLNVDNDTPALIIPAVATGVQTSETGAANTTTFTVALNKQPTTNVVVPITSTDVSEGLVQGGSSPTTAVSTINLTFTPADFSTPQTVTVVGQVDNAADGTQTYNLTVGPPTGDSAYTSLTAKAVAVTNVDVDLPGFTLARSITSTTEGGTAATFTVVLNRQPTANVTVPVASNNAAEAKVGVGASPATWAASVNLTFTPADWSTPQTVSVAGQLDSIDDGNQTYAITVGPTSAPTGNPYAGVAAQSLSYTNVDVDTAAFTVTPTTGLVTTEAGGTASFTVVLATKPTATVTIPVSAGTSDEVAVSTGGGTPTNYLTLTFAPDQWNVAQTVTVKGQGDTVADGAQPWSVSVGPAASGDTKYSGLAAKTVTGVNNDDDATNQGSVASPINITGLVPYASQVGSGSSYYMITGLTAGNGNVALTGVSGDVTLDVYSTSDFATTSLCQSANAGVTAGELCTFAVPGSGTVYIKVSAASGTTGAVFTIGVNVTLTWTSTDVPKTIADYASATSIISVSGGPSSIVKVTVKVNITHGYDGDIALYLKSPAGNEITLSYYRGSSGDNYTDTVFDDAAATSITTGVAPFTGTFRPEGLLSTFNGQGANGTWTLRVYDGLGGYTGTITGWSITLN